MPVSSLPDAAKSELVPAIARDGSTGPPAKRPRVESDAAISPPAAAAPSGVPPHPAASRIPSVSALGGLLAYDSEDEDED